MNTAEYFKKNKYIYLSNVVSREDCGQLTDYMFSLYDQGKLVKDDQCPVSDSVYGDPIFDGLLEKLCAPLSAQLGIELAPAYTYARIYRPGEILVKHKDRPSCEISGTMTLGFDPGSGIWPIYMGKSDDDVVGSQLEINVGDLVMYHGNELYHWRPEYKGKWQVQVFFHYVDKNGEHAEWAYDKRPELGVDKSAATQKPVIDKSKAIKPQQPASAPVTEMSSQIITDGVMIRTCDDVFPGAATYHSGFKPEHTFSPEECQRILDLNNKLYPVKSTVGSGESEGTYDPKIRAVDTYNIEYREDTKWIFDKIAAAVGNANAEYYKFDLLGITHALQLLHYKSEENGHYDWHIDCGDGKSATRKLSLSIPLTDRDVYEGGKLEINNNGNIVQAVDEQGSISFFPSYLVHRVSPVTKGERWVIVVWVHGPNRFR
jgi:PKHD-type hydroxylase